jgi:hypothetical protein
MERKVARIDRPLSNWRQATGDNTVPTHDEIAERAHAIYLRRGGTNGYDLSDWLQAERECLSARIWGFEQQVQLRS